MAGTYLVFGDLHGRVLPAFALARAWQREHGEAVTALLQVGDLGYFPYLDRLDRATKRFARRDPLELGVQQLLRPSALADALFAHGDVPGPMWFVAGNHEDHRALADAYGGPGSTDDDFPADAYGRLRCLVSGRAVTLPGGLRVGGLWGIDHEAPAARRNVAPEARVDARQARQLAMRLLDVLLTHDSPRDVMFPDSGSEAITLVVELARPAFAFFGHYHGAPQGRRDPSAFLPTRLFHLAGLEFQGPGHTAEDRCAGVLRWRDTAGGTFDYLEPAWLRSVSRHNWASR